MFRVEAGVNELALASLKEAERRKIEDGKVVKGQRTVDRDDKRRAKLAKIDFAGNDKS